MKTRLELVEGTTQAFIKEAIEKDIKIKTYDYGSETYIKVFNSDMLEDGTIVYVTRDQLAEIRVNKTEEYMKENNLVDLRDQIIESIVDWN